VTDAFAAAVEAVRTGTADPEAAAADLRGRLSDHELLWLLDGDAPMLRGLRDMGRRYNQTPYVAGRIERLGIPGIRFTDGPRGVVVGSSTAFPVSIARAASWDPALERRVGAVIGAEARAQGANLIAAVCVNLPPFPGWGRTQECYGEEPVLIGAMGAALTEGLQPWVMACVKHYAVNSMEEARFVLDVEVGEGVLREVYLPHFRTVVEAGVDCVMSAYNSVNGQWAGDSHHLLTEILRDDWGFRGFVMTDFVWGLRDPVGSVAAGQDLEMPLRQQRARTLPRAARDGRLRREDVERAATRLLATQLRYAARAEPAPSPGVVACDEHRALARETAARGAVLLRNATVDGGPVLPLSAGALENVAVLGRLADQENLGDHGSSLVHPPAVASVLDGLRERLGPRVRQVAADDVESARTADAAVVVVGLGPHDEGEALAAMDADAIRVFGGITRLRPVAGALSRMMAAASRRAGIVGGDRRDLRLPAEDVALIRAVTAVNPRTVVVVIGGGTIVVDPWDAAAGAVLLAWYPGMEGGRAIAGVLLGDAEPGGRLPVAIPRRATDLPTVDWRARRVTYPRWWGQRALDRAGVAAAYPLGFGLGYTTFALADLTVGPVTGESFPVGVTVTNTGDRTGRHVVQVYARPAGPQPAVRALVGFASVEVAPGQAVPVTIECSTRPLQRWTEAGFTAVAGTVTVEAGGYSGDPAALTLSVPGGIREAAQCE
jgi:beta-glucosidase